MSVLIRDMEMPDSCLKCPLRFGILCQVINEHVDPSWKHRKHNCSLVDLGSHGRLIDADVLATESFKDGAYGYVSTKQIYDAETIIGAE